jgi:hypothetical protein
MNLDDVLPDPHHRMCHSRNVGAPTTVVWDELHRVSMSALPLGRALEGVRLLPARLAGKKHPPLAGRTFLDVTPISVLFSATPGRDHSRPQPGLAPAGRSDTTSSGRGGAASLVATRMDQGWDGVSPPSHPGGHAVAH